MRILFKTLGVAVLCATMQPVLAETTAEAAAAAEVRQAVRIEAPSELPKAAVAPAAPETEGGAGLALPKGFDAPKLDQKAVAQAPTPAPIPVADENPAPVMPACNDPRTVELVETDRGTALMVAPICADQVRLSLTDRDGAILKPEFNVIDRTLRADLPCGRVFKAVKMMVGFQPVSVGLVPRELPCSEQVIEAAMPVEEAAPAAPAVPQSGCGNAFDGAVVDGILTAGFSGCNTGEVVTLTYRDHAFDGIANADGMAQTGGPMNRRQLRGAGFSVLKAADIPSVLIEIGFLSSPRDLRNLLNPDWRAGMAVGIRNGLLAWRANDLATRPLVRQ